MKTLTDPKIISRAFRDDEDFWRIRSLCLGTYPTTGLGWNWDHRRWDGARFHRASPALNPEWERTIRLWETGDGQLMGAANTDGGGWLYLQLHPDYRERIEAEMLAWAEETLAVPLPGSDQRQASLEVWEYDAPRQQLLERRGYEKLPTGGVIRRLRFDGRPLPGVKLAPGYSLRSVHPADLEECQRMAALLNAAFNRTIHTAEEFQQFARLAPSFREDLHLVAEAPDGSFAAHVGVIYDEANRRGIYEPVCTHPDHRRKNLAQGLMYEGLHRLQSLGACEVTVDTGDMIPANALYNSIGFTEAYPSRVWRKVF